MINILPEIITADIKFPSPYTHRVLMLCHIKKIIYKITTIDMYQKPDWFLNIAPLGQVPIMRIDDEIITDSKAVCSFLDNLTSGKKLFPAEPLEYAKHLGWLTFADEIAQEITQFVKQKKQNIADLKRLGYLLKIIDKKIRLPFFFGEDVSFVDIGLISHLLWLHALEEKVLPFTLLQKYSNLWCWFDKMLAQKFVKETAKDFNQHFINLLIEKELLPT